MGEIADWYEDMAIQQMAEYDAWVEQAKEKAEVLLEEYNHGIAKWRTKNDKEIPVKEMGDEHVKNCYNLLVKQYKQRLGDNENPLAEAWMKIFDFECRKRKIDTSEKKLPLHEHESLDDFKKKGYVYVRANDAIGEGMLFFKSDIHNKHFNACSPIHFKFRRLQADGTIHEVGFAMSQTSWQTLISEGVKDF